MDFIGKRKLWYILSMVIIIPGIISMAIQGLNVGIDFTGGSVLQVKFEQQVTTEQLRDQLAVYDLGNSQIQEVEGGSYQIKAEAMTQEQQEQLTAALEAKLGSLELLRSEMVGPTIGKELRTAGIASLAIAVVAMVIYITFRFEFKFALAAILALAHDILVTLSVFSILQLEIGSSFIAAILTIFGYSINDTIVVFDRIRENMKGVKDKQMAETVNASIKQTLTRSINTSVTTLVVLIALFVFGGETTKVFVLAMIIGIASGTYSSIFVASPLWYELRMGRKKQAQAA